MTVSTIISWKRWITSWFSVLKTMILSFFLANGGTGKLLQLWFMEGDSNTDVYECLLFQCHKCRIHYGRNGFTLFWCPFYKLHWIYSTKTIVSLNSWNFNKKFIILQVKTSWSICLSRIPQEDKHQLRLERYFNNFSQIIYISRQHWEKRRGEHDRKKHWEEVKVWVNHRPE